MREILVFTKHNHIQLCSQYQPQETGNFKKGSKASILKGCHLDITESPFSSNCLAFKSLWHHIYLQCLSWFSTLKTICWAIFLCQIQIQIFCMKEVYENPSVVYHATNDVFLPILNCLLCNNAIYILKQIKGKV